MKQTEIGEIPKDWKLDYLENITKQISDIDHFMPPSVRVGIPYLMTSDLQPKISQVNFDKCKQVDSVFYDRFARKIKAELDDVVFARYATIGTVSYVDVNKKFLVSYSCVVIKPYLAKVYGKYLYHYFKSDVFFKSVQLLLNSNIQSNIGIDGLNKTKILLPSKKEQEQIIEVLSDTDNLIQATEQLIDKKQLIKTATMQNLLTGKIRLAEFDTKQKKPSELGDIPSDWDLVSYGQVFTFLSTSSNSRADLNENGDYLYLHYGDIHTRLHNTIDIRKANLPRVDKEFSSSAFVKNGDLIMADASEDCEGIGKSIEISNLKPNEKMVSGLHTFLLRDFDSKLVDGYRAYIHQIPTVKRQFDKLATGLKVYGLSKNNLQTVIFAIPKKDEQNAIAQILFDMDKEIIVLNERLSKLKDIKKGLMQNLLTGKIRLTE